MDYQPPKPSDIEACFISEIVLRTQDMETKYGADIRDDTSISMDMMAAVDICGLDLERLIEADDVNFAHDVFGIANNLDRENGKMLNCFLPRFTKQALLA